MGYKNYREHPITLLTKGSQVENENLEDVRGIQLSNDMKNMDIGELRPRQINEIKKHLGIVGPKHLLRNDTFLDDVDM